MALQDRFDHEHTYFPLQNNATKSVFEPITIRRPDEDDSDTYKMVEYMYLFCKCGDAIRTRVKTKTKIEGTIDARNND